MTKFPLSYTHMKEVAVLDKKVFKICEIKEKQIGTVRKKLIYLHFSGKEWHILSANANFSEIEFFSLK